ncbi:MULTISPECIES: hypothetical protein [unclassified Streptomyces]|uniref:hypothetical protein n=1 Tax=unclassified Streptomyces TaxID=2593676 RepID=UPI002E1F6242
MAIKKITTLAAAALISATTFFGTANAVPMPAQPHPWDHRVKCETKDPDDRKIVAHYGNSEFGWIHFSGPHNIKKCSTLYAALHGEVDRKFEQGRKLEYDAIEFETGVPRPRQVKITVVVWQARKSLDGRYDAGRGNTIGVITAYCHNQRGNRCPAWAKL